MPVFTGKCHWHGKYPYPTLHLAVNASNSTVHFQIIEPTRPLPGLGKVVIGKPQTDTFFINSPGYVRK